MTAASPSHPVLDRNWALVAAGALMTCVAIGVVFSLAVFLDPLGTDTGWSRAGISAAMTLAFLAMGLSGFGWGTLSDRLGPRPVVLAGVVLLGLASVLASRATTLLQFQVTFGVLIGAAAGAFFAPIIAATSVSFEKRRGLAIALVSAGMGVAPMTIAPLAGWLVTLYGWRTTMLGIGIGTWVVLLPFVRWIRVVPAAVAPGGDVGPRRWPAMRSTRASRARCSAPRPCFRAWAWRSGPSSAAGCSTVSAPTPGCTSAR
jgi:MFS family permease